jgi:hypothetical protein
MPLLLGFQISCPKTFGEAKYLLSTFPQSQAVVSF